MGDQKEQALPLAPIVTNRRQEDDEDTSKELKPPVRTWIKCCGCIAAIFLILAVIVIALVFTLFHIKSPLPKMNDIQIKWNLSSDSNIIFVADITIKNPNVASFKIDNSTAIVYYEGIVVGESRNSPGKVKARKTLRMNVRVEIIPEKVFNVPSFAEELNSGALEISNYIEIEGWVKVHNLYKRFMKVNLNCTVDYNVSSQSVQDKHCINQD